jgi:hypothetical protein
VISFAFGATPLTVRRAACTVGRTADGTFLRSSYAELSLEVGIGRSFLAPHAEDDGNEEQLHDRDERTPAESTNGFAVHLTVPAPRGY